MTIELTQAEVAVVKEALDAWEKQPDSAANVGASVIAWQWAT
jgi:hypothetical protein